MHTPVTFKAASVLHPDEVHAGRALFGFSWKLPALTAFHMVKSRIVNAALAV